MSEEEKKPADPVSVTPAEVVSPTSIGVKFCCRCRQDIPRSEFFPMPSGRYGLMHWCKSCGRKAAAKGVGRRKKGRLPELYRPQRAEEIADYFIKNPMGNPKECANQLRVSERSVRDWMSTNPYLKALRMMATGTMSNFLPLAVKGFKQFLTGPNEKLRYDACVELLKSEKVLGPGRLEVHVNDFANRSKDELMEIIRRAAAIPKPIFEGELVD